MIGEAKAAGAHTMILSSENLEGVVFNPEIALLIERVAADHGFDEIEWHAVIREPGAYFESLHSQLSWRSEEHTSELQSLMRISYAVFCLKKKKREKQNTK